jgi:cobalt/nickel transport system ATP-binding protein
MIKIQDLHAEYPDKSKAIQGIDLTISDGESVAVIGENGAGKTSLLHCIVGILEPSKGIVEVDGMRMGSKTINEIRKRVGLVFQNPDDQLFMPYIYDDIAFGCRNYGMTEGESRACVEYALRQLSIGHLRDRSSLKLSGGEKRMAAIATVLAIGPSILMFDEPTAFLDPKGKRALAEALKALSHTMLLATHDMEFALGTCGRVVILKDGRVAADGPPGLLRDKALLEKFGLC